MVFRLEELIVRQDALRLGNEIDKLSETFAKKELFGLSCKLNVQQILMY